MKRKRGKVAVEARNSTNLCLTQIVELSMSEEYLAKRFNMNQKRINISRKSIKIYFLYVSYEWD